MTGPRIQGYKNLSQGQVDLANTWKGIESELDWLLGQCPNQDPAAKRWNAMARSDLERGIMFAVKAIAHPDGGLGNALAPAEGPITTEDLAGLKTFGAQQQPELVDPPKFADKRPKLTEEQLAADREKHGFDPYALAKADPMTEEGRPPQGEQDPEPAPSKSMAAPPSTPTATFGASGAKRDQSPITSDRQNGLPAKSDRDLQEGQG